MGVLLRLLLMSVRGRIVRSFRMLRQPKYMIGSVIGVGWVVFWIASSTGNGRLVRFGAADFEFDAAMAAGLQVPAAAVLALVASSAWLLPWGKLGLGLKEAELHVLLPAPLSRRQIIQYALLKNQIGLLITAAVFSVFAGSGTPVERLVGFVGFWAVFNVWDLNSKLRGVFLLRQFEIPRSSALKRRAMLVAALVIFWALVLPPLLDAGTRALVPVRDFEGWVTAFSGVLSGFQEEMAGNRVASFLLQPFVWVVRPLFTREPLRFLLALIPAAAVFVAHHELIVRSPARFEEASLELAEKEARKKSPTKGFAKISERSRRQQPFALPSLGSPEVAVLWKNTIAKLRRPLGRTVLFTLGLLALIAVALPLIRMPTPFYIIIAMIGAFGMVMFPFASGIAWHNDFRGEFRHVELVRTWPVSAERLVMAEVLSPALLSILAAAAGAGLILASMFGAMFAESLGINSHELLPESGAAILGVRYEVAVPLILLGALLLLAGLATLSSALQNLAALFLPAWISHGTDATKGMAAFGNRLLFASALGLVFFFAMIPSTLLVFIAVGLQWLAGIPWTAWLFPLWGLLGAAPLLVGARLVIGAGAGLWRRMDPAEELLESAG